jgi:hypothetical protein
MDPGTDKQACSASQNRYWYRILYDLTVLFGNALTLRPPATGAAERADRFS